MSKGDAVAGPGLTHLFTMRAALGARLAQLAQNRHPSLNKSTSWSKSWHYIFGKVTGEKAFLDTNLSCRRESRGLVGVNCGGWHYIIKSMLRAT